jgi:3-deoxy-D-manno-octulosonate 8-phosphate phosphatase KdsC-like HAD superfamily phosphatase
MAKELVIVDVDGTLAESKVRADAFLKGAKDRK